MEEMKMNPEGNLEEVIWVPIKGYERIYVINQFGDVRSLDRSIIDRLGRIMHFYEKSVKITQRPSTGLRSVNLLQSSFSVRRLVAEAFLSFDRTRDDLFIRTNSDDPSNCYYKNLEIISRYEFFSEIAKNTLKSGKLSNARPVRCVTKVEEVYVFDNVVTARDYIGTSINAIRKCIKAGIPDSEGNLWYDIDKVEQKKLGISERRISATRSQILDLYKSGMNRNQIGIKLHTSRLRVNRIVQEYLADNEKED